jgi:hypothetical protein
MADNKEFFKYLEIEESCAAARNICAVDSTLNVRMSSIIPSEKIVQNIMSAAEKKNTGAIKRFFSAFTYRRAFAAAVVLAVLITMQQMVIKKTAADTDVYSYAVAHDFDELGNGLDDIMAGLDSMIEECI